jgi:hypothetical protein
MRYSDDAGEKSVSADVRAWALAHGDDPRLRIVLAGYEGEHDMPASWRVASWRAKRGYGTAGNNRRERLWLSPHCLGGVSGQLALGGAS